MYSICYIKNIDTQTQNVLGVSIAASATYQIPDEKRLYASKNQKLLDGINDGTFQIGDGTTFYTIASESINYLSGNIPTNVSIKESKPFADALGFRARFQGFSGTATKNSTTNLDFVIPEERYINGIRLIIENHVIGDKLNFEVVDKDYTYAGILYPSDYNGTAWSIAAPNGVVLDQFGKDWYLDPGICTQPDVTTPYPARILAGLYLRVTYISIGLVNDPLVKLNTYLHWKAV